MPALSNGNTCWGNRKAFNMHTEYISDSFLLGLEMGVGSVPSAANFISTNHYYGYHRVPEPHQEAPQVAEEMVVDDSDSTTCEQTKSACRKRPNSAEQNVNTAKRICNEEPMEPSSLSDPLRQDQDCNSIFFIS